MRVWTQSALIVGFLILMMGCGDTSPSDTSPDAEDSASGDELTDTTTSSPDEEDQSTDSPDDAVDGCVNTFGVLENVPAFLSETGLYTNISTKEVHASVWDFDPKYRLWSDSAEKMRWIYLPECEPIDTRNMDDWSLPVGSQLFKEFIVDGKRVETRFITRTGPSTHDYLYATYIWNEDETEATLAAAEGVPAGDGLPYDIPSEPACRQCHGDFAIEGGRPSRALGFSALLLSHDDDGLTLDDLVSTGRLSHPPEGPIEIPGDDVARQAIGYLHVNCGGCHNATTDAVPHVDLNLWYDVGQTDVEQTPAYLTAVGRANQSFNDQHVTARIEPGVPEASSIIYRMSERGNNAQMPPIGTTMIDEAGIALVEAWVESLQ